MGVWGSPEQSQNSAEQSNGTLRRRLSSAGHTACATPATCSTTIHTPPSPTPSTATRSAFHFPQPTPQHPIATSSGYSNLSYSQSIELTSGTNLARNDSAHPMPLNVPLVGAEVDMASGSQFGPRLVSQPSHTSESYSTGNRSWRDRTREEKMAKKHGSLPIKITQADRNASPPANPRTLSQSGSLHSNTPPTFRMAPNRLANHQFHSQTTVNTNPDPSQSLRPKYERMHSGRLSVYIPEETVDALPYRRPYRYRDMFLTLWAIGTYMVDYVMDWVVAAGFYRDKDYYWFGLTVTFIVVPHLTMMCFSLAWYLQDQKSNPTVDGFTSRQWLVRIVVLILQLAPVLRYVDSLRYGYRFRHSKHVSRLDLYESLCFENADAAMLRLFEAFMEAAPQLVLQIYIIIYKQSTFEKFGILETLQIISIITSWISLATAMATFHRAQRFSQHGKGSMSLLGTIMQFGWHLFIFASRVIAIALFTVRFNFWGPVACALHVVVMIVWVFSQRTDFCPNRWLEYLYNIAVGCLYLFAFLNVKDTPTRWKYVFYYGLYYAENVVLITLWWTHTRHELHWFREPAMAAVIGGFWIGIVCFMLPYYLLLHPEKGLIIRRRREKRAMPGHVSNQPRWWKRIEDCCL